MIIRKKNIQAAYQNLNRNPVPVGRPNLEVVKAPSLVGLSIVREESPRAFKQYAGAEVHTNLQPIRHNYFLVRITKLIEENLDDDEYGITELCRSAGISRTQLHRNVRKYADVSTTEFINDIRLQHARIMLLETDLNIGQVAFAVGFTNPKYFSRLFSKVFQVSPRAFRKKSITLA